MSKDYYEILGISKSASQADVKVAFRKKALEHHPDKGGNAEKFKEINEAYQALGDEKTRAQYDRYGSSYDQMRNQGFQGAGFDPNEMGFDIGDLSDLFGGLGNIFGGRGRGQSRGRDIEVQIDIAFNDAVHGATRELELDKVNQCKHCNGSAAEPGTKFNSCLTCGGSGKVAKIAQSFLGSIQTVVTCHVCHGQGNKPEKECGRCSGKGVSRGKRIITVKIPAGIEDGGTIRFAGEGEAVKGAGSGDLYVHVSVRSHNEFDRKGNDIWSKLAIPFKVAALGGKVDVNTVDGVKELKIPSGTQSGNVIRMKSFGVPYLRSSSRGDHFVEIHIKVPQKLSRHQKKILQEFD